MKNYRMLVLLVVSILLMGTLAACAAQPPAPSEPAAVEATAVPAAEEPAAPMKKFVIASDAAFPPMEYVDENKEIVGFDMDLIAAIAKDQGFEYEIKNTAWDGIFAGLEGGEYNGILSAVTITDERKEVYDFSEPYINAGQTVVVRADETAITGDQDLSGKTVGAQIGTTGAFAVQEIDGATLKEYDSIDLALLDLLNQNLDAVVVDTPVAADYALASEQFSGKLKIVGEPFTDEYYGLTVQKGDPSGLAALFNAGLVNVKASGEYDKIYARWIGGTSP